MDSTLATGARIMPRRWRWSHRRAGAEGDAQLLRQPVEMVVRLAPVSTTNRTSRRPFIKARTRKALPARMRARRPSSSANSATRRNHPGSRPPAPWPLPHGHSPAGRGETLFGDVQTEVPGRHAAEGETPLAVATNAAHTLQDDVRPSNKTCSGRARCPSPPPARTNPAPDPGLQEQQSCQSYHQCPHEVLHVWK